ncbi:MAG: uncharacterized protein JWR41_2922, partial [Modestobacter sp.]|nr:uncharacterized protein [Modestobacter sp.]
MRTINESTGGQTAAGAQETTTHRATRAGQAARAGVPTIHLAHTSDPHGSPGSRASVPAQASTGVAELLRGPVRSARVLLSVPAAVYLTVQTTHGPDVVGVLTSDAARLPLGCVLFRPSNGRPLVSVPSGAPARVGGGRLVVGDLTVSAAAWWDPRPKLPTARPALLPEGVRQLRAALYGEGVPHSAFVLPGLPSGPSGPLAALRGAVR